MRKRLCYYYEIKPEKKEGGRNDSDDNDNRSAGQALAAWSASSTMALTRLSSSPAAAA